MKGLAATLRTLLRRPPAATPSPSASGGTPLSPPPARAASAFAYPPKDPGIPFRPVDEILAANEALIARIKLAYGTDHATFAQELLPLIRNHAAYVNLLPATPDNHFSSPGGLFRLGLEVAFFALQATDAHIVSGRATISTRRQLEPRWRTATFVAGLCGELHRALGQMVVTDDRGQEWPTFLEPLTTWMQRRYTPSLYVRWVPNAQSNRAVALFALQHVVPPAMLQYLAEENASVVPQLLASLSGIPLYRDRNVLDDLVKRATALVIDRDLIAMAHRLGRPILGSHLERYLIDAMQRLVANDPAWTPNAERSRVWLAADGLYVLWPNAVADILKLLEQDEFQGFPRSPETLLDILTASGALMPPEAPEPLWTIAPPPAKARYPAIRMRATDLLLTHLPSKPAPLPRAIACATQEPATAAAPSAPASGSSTKPGIGKATPPSTATPGAAPEPQGAPAQCTARPPPAAVSTGQQLPLPIAPTRPASGTDTNAQAVPAASSPTRSDNACPSGPQLKPPLRLTPAVREALEQILAAMNSPAPSGACVMSSGVFVPLRELRARHITRDVALRALSEVRMLACEPDGTPHLVTRTLGSQRDVGVVVLPSFFDGLDLKPAAD